jgi:hypothetical protein
MKCQIISLEYRVSQENRKKYKAKKLISIQKSTWIYLNLSRMIQFWHKVPSEVMKPQLLLS